MTNTPPKSTTVKISIQSSTDPIGSDHFVPKVIQETDKGALTLILPEQQKSQQTRPIYFFPNVANGVKCENNGNCHSSLLDPSPSLASFPLCDFMPTKTPRSPLHVILPLQKLCCFSQSKCDNHLSVSYQPPQVEALSQKDCTRVLVTVPQLASPASACHTTQRLDSGYHDESTEGDTQWLENQSSISYLTLRTNFELFFKPGNAFDSVQFQQDETHIVVTLQTKYLHPSVVTMAVSPPPPEKGNHLVHHECCRSCFVIVFGVIVHCDPDNQGNDIVNCQCCLLNEDSALSFTLTKAKLLHWSRALYRFSTSDPWTEYTFASDDGPASPTENGQNTNKQSSVNKQSHKKGSKKNGKSKNKSKKLTTDHKPEKSTMAAYKEKKLRNADSYAEDKEILKNMEPIETMRVPLVEFSDSSHLQCSGILKRSESVSSAGDDLDRFLMTDFMRMKVTAAEIAALTDELPELDAKDAALVSPVVVNPRLSQRTFSTSSNKSVSFTSELVDTTWYHNSESVIQLHKRLITRQRNQRKREDRRTRRSSHSNSISMDTDDSESQNVKTSPDSEQATSSTRMRSFSESALAWMNHNGEENGDFGNEFVDALEELDFEESKEEAAICIISTEKPLLPFDMDVVYEVEDD